jgi:hypothetical protein
MFKFYFQNGTFETGQSSFWIDLFISAFGAFLGIIGAYLIYFVSINHIRRDRLKYIAALLDSVISSVKKQAEHCIQHAKFVTSDPLKLPLLKIEANRDIKRLADKVDQEGVYHAFLNKYSRNQDRYKEFQRIYGYIDYVDYTLDDLLNFNEKTLLSIWERKKEYSTAFREAKERVEAIIINGETKAQYLEYVQFLSKTLENFFNHNHEGENIIYTYQSLVTPVRDYLIKNGPMTASNTELMFILNRAVNHYTGIEMAAKHAAKEYNDYGKQLTQAAESLEKSTRQLRVDFG